MTELRDIDTGAPVTFEPKRLIVAGFTGRNQSKVQEHLDELAAIGVPVPGAVPVFYGVGVERLTSAASIVVSGSQTSGEIEPVVVVDEDGERWLVAGSDHTDRDMERTSIQLSKEACPKVISSDAVRIDAAEPWDGITLTSWVDGQPTPYQQGELGQILPLSSMLERLAQSGTDLAPGDVLFLGTVPVTGGALRPADVFRGELSHPAGDWTIRVDYTIAVGPEADQ